MSETAKPSPNEHESISHRLAEARAMLRGDITVSRQVFRGEPSYMLHDPVAFANHRLSMQDYRVVAALDDKKTLRECFDQIADQGMIDPAQDEAYFRFIVRLQSLNLLSLPSDNGPELYERHKAMQKAKLKSLPMQAMFLRIPLAHPDKFLDRTVSYVSWMFTRGFAVVWMMGMLIAGAVLAIRYEDFFQPLNGMLTTSNFITLSIVLGCLKIWHELGHGYACKHFGGRVPEMGMLLLLGMPLAYVDASAAWTFASRRHRIMVMLGGMYFESLVAIPAVFVWAIMGPSTMIGSIAYQIVFMATAITVLFNANPLMKYDGYFVLSELLGMPNLKQNSTREIYSKFNRHVLGAEGVLPSSESRSAQTYLILYGLASGIYRVFLTISLTAILATKAFIIGLLMGVVFVITSLGKPLYEFAKFLWFAEETKSVRKRAIAVSIVPFVLVPLALFLLPTPGGISTIGVVGGEREHVVRCKAPGFVKSIDAVVGQPVSEGATIATLVNADLNDMLSLGRSQLGQSEMQYRLARQTDLASMAQLEHQVKAIRASVDYTQQNVNDLVLRSPAIGKLASITSDKSTGQFMNVGEPLATVVDGKTIVRVWMTGENARLVSARVGDHATVRFPGARLEQATGTIKHISPATASVMEEFAVTHIAGGDIPITGENGETIEPLVEYWIELPDTIQDKVAHRSQASVRFDRAYDPVAWWMGRKLLVFLQKLMMS